jgi:hypothetical protein
MKDYEILVWKSIKFGSQIYVHCAIYVRILQVNHPSVQVQDPCFHINFSFEKPQSQRLIKFEKIINFSSIK